MGDLACAVLELAAVGLTLSLRSHASERGGAVRPSDYRTSLVVVAVLAVTLLGLAGSGLLLLGGDSHEGNQSQGQEQAAVPGQG